MNVDIAQHAVEVTVEVAQQVVLVFRTVDVVFGTDVVVRVIVLVTVFVVVFVVVIASGAWDAAAEVERAVEITKTKRRIPDAITIFSECFKSNSPRLSS